MEAGIDQEENNMNKMDLDDRGEIEQMLPNLSSIWAKTSL